MEEKGQAFLCRNWRQQLAGSEQKELERAKLGEGEIKEKGGCQMRDGMKLPRFPACLFLQGRRGAFHEASSASNATALRRGTRCLRHD